MWTILSTFIVVLSTLIYIKSRTFAAKIHLHNKINIT